MKPMTHAKAKGITQKSAPSMTAIESSSPPRSDLLMTLTPPRRAGKPIMNPMTPNAIVAMNQPQSRKRAVRNSPSIAFLSDESGGSDGFITQAYHEFLKCSLAEEGSSNHKVSNHLHKSTPSSPPSQHRRNRLRQLPRPISPFSALHCPSSVIVRRVWGEPARLHRRIAARKKTH